MRTIDQKKKKRERKPNKTETFTWNGSSFDMKSVSILLLLGEN